MLPGDVLQRLLSGPARGDGRDQGNQVVAGDGLHQGHVTVLERPKNNDSVLEHRHHCGQHPAIQSPGSDGEQTPAPCGSRQ
ncbi:hypothetical protein [Ornithinimicrobium kibberense]|uniref:hypothetical protein n=1 Tax=Ornithinimicrobium kibberense TaxID=282060 RepID=UPI00360CE3E1